MATPYETLRYVHRDSEEYRNFIKKLENNYESSNKLSMCLMCWGFLTSYQKKKHMAHTLYIITPSFCKNEEQFMKNAIAQKKTKDNNQLIAVFNESCQQLLENHYYQPPAAPRQVIAMNYSQAFNRNGQSNSTNMPLNQFSFAELRNLAQKQFE